MRRTATDDSRAHATSKHPAALAGDPLALLSRTTSAMVRAGGDVQQQMARSAGQLQQEAVRELRLATTPADLVTVQAAWMLAGWQQSMQCSQAMAHAWRAALEAAPARH
jgi:hypothetical protein